MPPPEPKHPLIPEANGMKCTVTVIDGVVSLRVETSYDNAHAIEFVPEVLQQAGVIAQRRQDHIDSLRKPENQRHPLR
jgi:hypothetical protein